MFCLTLIVPALKEFVMERFNASNAETTLFVSTEMVAYVIFAVVWGAVSDKAGMRKPFIVLGFAGTSLLYIMMIFAQSLPILLFLRFIQGAITILSWSLVMTSILDITKRTKYGMAMGMIGMAMTFGNAFGVIIGGRLAKINLYYPMYAAALLFFIATFISLFFLKDYTIESKPESVGRALGVLGEKRELVVPYAFSFVDRFTVGFFIGLFPLFLSNVYHQDPSAIGMFMASLLFPFALLQYPFGVLSDRVGRSLPILIGATSYGIFLIAIGYVDVSALAIPLLICGITAALHYPSTVALTGDLAPEGKRGAAIGGFNTFGSLGMAIGPFIGGVIADNYSYAASFTFAGLFVLLITLLLAPYLIKTRTIKTRGEK